MAINEFVYQRIAKHATNAGDPLPALSAGYPDMLIPRKLWPREDIDTRDDFDTINKRHGTKFDAIPESRAVFAALGYNLTVIDIVNERGIEEILDLNHPAPAHHRAKYALVVDCGTIEHCFNIAQAAINLAGMVAEKGIIIQDIPLAMFNHGFYNINPTWFYSFYEENGFEIVEHCVHDAAVNYASPGHKRFPSAPLNAMNTLIARRVEVKPFVYPIQFKYKPKQIQ